MDSDGTDPTNLTDNPANDGMPTFSPDGERIAFNSNRELPMGIYVMDADGANSTRLTDDQLIAGQPRFSPDGTKIAFIGGDVDVYAMGDVDVYAMNSDGTGLTRITNEGESADPTFPFFPVFSPDEQEILIKVDQEGNDEIYAVNSDGTDRVNVTNNDSAHDSQPTFSPDGKKMAFVSQRYDDSGKFVSEIYLMDLDR